MGLAKLYDLLEKPPSTGPSRLIQGGIQLLIWLNVIAVVVQTVEPWGVSYGPLFELLEAFSVAVFTVEYIARSAACTQNPKYSRPILGRLRYAVTPMAIIDFLAILPAYLPWLLPTDLRVLRAVRLMRIFRLLKLGRYSRAVRNLGNAITSRKEELFVTMIAMAILLVLASSVMYLAEHDAQPKVFSSIPASMWWAVETLTTVGYGDVFPVTALGKIAAACVAVLGIGFFALPAGILGSAFTQQMRQARKCPHCGREL